MSKEYDSEYLAYLNSMADILSQCDNGHYAWNDPEVMEKVSVTGRISQSGSCKATAHAAAHSREETHFSTHLQPCLDCDGV